MTLRETIEWVAQHQYGEQDPLTSDKLAEMISTIRRLPALCEQMRVALEHYAHADDGAYSMLKGFAAKADDKDPHSPANKALAAFEKEFPTAKPDSGGNNTGSRCATGKNTPRSAPTWESHEPA